MINFTVGPVQSSSEVLALGGSQVPYFRTEEFSRVMLENEDMVRQLAGAPDGSRVVFFTGSGTASMEASIINLLTAKDRALVVNGGSFGNRFCQLCSIHGIPYDEIKLSAGRKLRESDLAAAKGSYSAFLINKHETSTGVHYDMGLVADFCRQRGLMLIVDNISSFLADEFDMQSLGVDVMIAGSQKALACPPGVSLVVLSPRAVELAVRNESSCMYLDMKDALKNQERGQTPFTPAVGVLLQIHARLKGIVSSGGAKSEIAKVRALAEDFRSRIRGLPLNVFSEAMSNAVTPLSPANGMSAYDIFLRLKDGHGIWICPNGGVLRDKVFRVGHIGALTVADNATLVHALTEVVK